jgi:hypothetical protein
MKKMPPCADSIDEKNSIVWRPGGYQEGYEGIGKYSI